MYRSLFRTFHRRYVVFFLITLSLISISCTLNSSERLTSNIRIKNLSSQNLTDIKQESLIMKATHGNLLTYSDSFPDLASNTTGSYQSILSGYDRTENVSNSSYIKQMVMFYTTNGTQTSKTIFDDGLDYTISTWGYLSNDDMSKIRILPNSSYTIEITDSNVSLVKD